jgi:hypothetical protein
MQQKKKTSDGYFKTMLKHRAIEGWKRGNEKVQQYRQE